METLYKPHASSGKAFGLTQFTPPTAKSYGVKKGTSNRAVRSQIMGQAHYMSDLLKKYDGDYTLAVFAYNQGPGNVKKYLSGKPINTEQGREYVKRILGVTMPKNGKNYVRSS